MTKYGKAGLFNRKSNLQQKKIEPKKVDSLLDNMIDGREYQSIVDLIPKNGDIVSEIKKALKKIEEIRKIPCVCYMSNVINEQISSNHIDFSDDLPFKELIGNASEGNEIDVILVTPGGVVGQVQHFVTTLRNKYLKVNFILPYMCMSAGTIFILSGDDIFMDERSFIGPIDPQVSTKYGNWVPIQSIFEILEKIKEEGSKSLNNGEEIPWHYVRLLDGMDPKEIGNAYRASDYSIKIAKEFLINYKFNNWSTHKSTGLAVTQTEKEERANQIASKLCNNNIWKSHSYGINRNIANKDLQIQIKNLESVEGLEKATHRLWALFYYLFERTFISKMFISQNYSLIRIQNKEDGK